MRDRLHRFLNWLLGERCALCHTRVFPREQLIHYRACSKAVTG